MPDKISILLPTRKRIKAFTAFYNSIKETAEEFPEIVAYTDNDDQEAYDFLCGLDVKVINGPRIVLSQMWNECYKEATGNILMLGGDDIIFRTLGWDRMVKEAFDKSIDKIIYVFGDDGVHDEHLGTHGCIHRKWAQTLGYFTPPYFPCDYVDHWLNDLAELLNDRRVHLPFLTEHMHPCMRKSEWDATYAEAAELRVKNDMEGLYASLLPLRMKDLEKLKAVMS